FDSIVQAVAPARTRSSDPLSQVMFTFLNEPTRALLEGPGMEVEVLDLDRGRSNRDLTLRLIDGPVVSGPLDAAPECFETAGGARNGGGGSRPRSCAIQS